MAFGVFMHRSDSIYEDIPSSQKLHKGKTVKAFFSGLLPEENVRERLAGYLGVQFLHYEWGVSRTA